MQPAFFYHPVLDPGTSEWDLDEETSRHVVQVLRMKKGEYVNLTDGKGQVVKALITDDHKKHCSVQAIERQMIARPGRQVTIAISLLKNSSRFEWFLEKATEIGVSTIIPLICERTERQKSRHDRMLGICISAMLQSQQCWMPLLHEPISFDLLFRQEEINDTSVRWIAHCNEGAKRPAKDWTRDTGEKQLMLIGPEGDFSPREVELALQYEFHPVSLGETRLRAETAGVVASTLLLLA